MIKRIALIVLCSMLVFTACSKDKSKSKTVRAKNVAERTVDLAEDGDDSAAADDTPDDKAEDNAKVKRTPSGNRPVRHAGKGNDAPSDEEIARRNDEASKNGDGSARRGRPAAQEDAEVADRQPQRDDDTKPEPAFAPSESGESFDFAVDEDAPKPRQAKKRTGPNIDNIMSIQDLREHTGYAGALTQTDLVGQDSDNRYNVIRYSTDKTSELGFAVQVWKLNNDMAASKRFEDLFKQSFGGKKLKDVGTEAFIAAHHGIAELAFYDKNKRSVVMISCSSTICKKDQQLKDLATTIQRKL